MKNLSVISGLGISLCVFALTGCAGKSTTADLMRDDASLGQEQVDLKKQIAQDWEAGKALIVTGNNRVDDGESRLDSAEDDLQSARADIERGEQEIADGEKLVRDSEMKFRQDYPEVDLKQTN